MTNTSKRLSMKQKKPRRKRSLKVKRFIKKYLETGNATEAAMEVYNANSRKSAQALGSKLLSKDIVQDSLDIALQRQGLDDDTLLEDTYHFVKQGKANPHVKPADALRALEILFKVKGRLQPPATQSLTVHYSGMSKSELIAEQRRLRKLSGNILK